MSPAAPPPLPIDRPATPWRFARMVVLGVLLTLVFALGEEE